jgi:pimeloyl-ACP methyl ester carboxylesterase
VTTDTGPSPEVRVEWRQSGMGYRVLLPSVLSAQRPRMAVWLHGAGSGGTNLAQPLAPVLARHGFALLIPENKDFRGWTSKDLKELFGQVLPEAAQQYGLSAEQPLLIGYSAGAQAALHLWRPAPERWAGLVLVGGTPQLTTVDHVEDIAIAQEDAWRFAGTPILAISGERDPGASKWRSVLEKWKTAGVPLDFRQVPNLDHQWCVGAFERERLDRWLESVTAPTGQR